jgi:hypothetical protein
LRAGFPHSEILGSKPVCRLPEAYRRLPRPSSPVIAKASTTCTYSLDPITLNTLASTPSYRSYFSAWLPSPRLSTRQRYNHQTQSIVSRSDRKAIAHLRILTRSNRFTSSRFLKSNCSQSGFNSRRSAKSLNLIVGKQRSSFVVVEHSASR